MWPVLGQSFNVWGSTVAYSFDLRRLYGSGLAEREVAAQRRTGLSGKMGQLPERRSTLAILP
jgi:hypothetical protein